MTCRPAGPLTRPGVHVYGCRTCGCRLTAVPTARRDDWSYADDTGSTVLDETPQGLRDDPAKWWADLAERDIGIYSTHKAAVDLMWFSWWHSHQPGEILERAEIGPVPETCGQPMWSGPDGWVCRVHRTVFAYA
jgi:hypothetical protein